MRVLVDGGNSGSGGYLRYLSGIFGSGELAGDEVLLVCSPRVAGALGPLDPQVTVLVEPELDDPRRWRRLAWWWRRWPRLVREFSPDVVLHAAGLVRGRSGGRATVAVHHFMAPFSMLAYREYGPSRFAVSLLVTRVRLLRSFRRATGVVFLADYTQRVVSRQSGRIARSTVVPNAVAAPFFGRGAPRADPSPVRVLCVSTLFLFKYQRHVAEAIARLRRELDRDIRVDFVGVGEPRATTKLLRRIEELGAQDYARLVDVPAESMPMIYQDADVFVFPSADEAWPITLGEAMASGLPIACSDRMAMPDILRDAGTYFDPQDTDSISDALRRLLVDPGLRQRYGEMAGRYAEEFSWARSAAGVMGFLHQIGDEAR